MRKLISVKKKHINAGLGGICMYCPIALAVAEQTDWVAEINKDGIQYLIDDELHGIFRDQEVELPRSARRFIARFDKGLPVRPFSFYLEVPDA
jgi:hypothetical protein